MANKDLTISVVDDKRRIYGVEGAVDYLIPDTDWSTGVNFNVLKTESKVNGTWQKYDVKTASPSKATAYIGWAPDPWSLRVQSTTSFDVMAIPPWICSAVISFRWVHSASALKTSSTVTTPLSGGSVHHCTTARVTAQRHCTTTKAGAEPLV